MLRRFVFILINLGLSYIIEQLGITDKETAFIIIACMFIVYNIFMVLHITMRCIPSFLMTYIIRLCIIFGATIIITKFFYVSFVHAFKIMCLGWCCFGSELYPDESILNDYD